METQAIFEYGTLRLLRPLKFQEGSLVTIIVQDVSTEIAEAEYLRTLSHNPTYADLLDPDQDIYTLQDGEPIDEI